MIDTTVVTLGPLAPFHTARVLGLADVHVAVGLCRIAGVPEDEQVALAAALCVRALREGSVCIDLTEDPTAIWAPDEGLDQADLSDDPARATIAALPWPDPAEWAEAVSAHPLVAVGPHGPIDRPLRLVGTRLYLQRYWADEQVVRAEVTRRSRMLPADLTVLAAALDRRFPDAEPNQQRLATATACLRAVSIVAGGPGTGKTTTVARLLAVLREVRGGGLAIGLVAPTGKAAARLQEAVSTAVAEFDATDRARIGDVSASTLHRLLGWRPGSQGRFRHDRGNPLPHDVIVVDETSMVSLSMMARLLEALRPDAQLVLVGDPDQLASVDAGAVLGDLVEASGAWATPAQVDQLDAALASCCPRESAAPGTGGGVVHLDRTYRYSGAIAELAAAVRDGAADAALAVLTRGDPTVEFLDTTDPAVAARAIDEVRAEVVAQADAIRSAARRGAASEALRALERSRVLCAHRRGPAGVAFWNSRIAEWTRLASGHPDEGQWWIGRPLLVTANDYAADVYNGDTGVIVATDSGRPRAAFARGDDPVLLAPARLQQVETLHAMTIHRGQGSQFTSVTVMLPPPDSPLLTRELVYTAITRARERVRVVGTPEAVRAALARPVRRASGLRAEVVG